MADLAPGAAAGYLFQFEKALSMIASLENSLDVISIEKVDDVAIHDETDVVIVAIQAKHTISPSGTTFEDTSKSLWRTIEIWIQKLDKGILTDNTSFICVTNKKIHDNALIKRIANENLENAILAIKALLEEQNEKLKQAQAIEKDAGSSIKQTIKRIEFVLSKPDLFSIIKTNLKVQDEYDPKKRFFVAIHMANERYSDTVRQHAYQAMYGWLADRSKAKWLNSEYASFSKKDFEDRFFFIHNNPAIVNAIFRKKEMLGSIEEKDFNIAKQELFVKQIAHIKRREDAKASKIEEAIINFICYDIELAHIISKNGSLTISDFEKFRANCKLKWKSCFDSHVIKELEEYTAEEKNLLAVKIFDFIMDNVELKFQDGFDFNPDNKYIHNGTFLKLSNVPEIGWHPEWESLYK